MIPEWDAYKKAQAESNAAYEAYRAAADKTAVALKAYTEAFSRHMNALSPLDVEGPLNPGDEAVLVGVQQ